MNDFENEERGQFATPRTQKGWLGRNWLWFVPLGCLTPIAVCAGIFGLTIFGVVASLKTSEAYTTSLAKAQTSAEVKEALGDNIQPGSSISGNFNSKNNTADAEVSYDISGTKGEGKMRCKGKKMGGEWTFSIMEVTVNESDKVINLLE